MAIEKTIDERLAHFHDCVTQGNLPTSSSGEEAAFKIAKVLMENLGFLDDDAVVGLIAWIRMKRFGQT